MAGLFGISNLPVTMPFPSVEAITKVKKVVNYNLPVNKIGKQLDFDTFEKTNTKLAAKANRSNTKANSKIKK